MVLEPGKCGVEVVFWAGLWGFRVAIWACWASRAGDGGLVEFTRGLPPARRAPAAGRRGLGRESRRSAPGGGDAQPRRHPCGARIADAGGGAGGRALASGCTAWPRVCYLEANRV